MSIEIELTQGRKTTIDDQDLSLIQQYKWHAHFKHGRWEAATAKDYTTITMGRLLLGLGVRDKRRVEYVNGDRLDNRRANIRIEQKNKINRHDGIVEIELIGGKWAIVDETDYELVKGYTWHAVRGGHTWYASTGIRQEGKLIQLGMHQLIQGRKGIDHVDRDGLNNRRNNLRDCSSGQNAANARKHGDAKHSRYKGVTKAPGNRTKPWVVRIIVNYRRIYGGFFADEIQAAKAYDGLARQYFGAYARVNFPGDAT